MTLSDQQDYELSSFNTKSHKEYFSPIYGPNLNGDITQILNQEYFIVNVLADTDDVGVHIVCADGSYPVIGAEMQNEQMCLDLYLCQCIVGLSILRKGGVFVCKFFDTHLQFSIGLLYIMYACFDEICVYKPIASRPGNSEKYFIGKGFVGRKDVKPLLAFLFAAVKNMEAVPLNSVELISTSTIMKDTMFWNYLKSRIHEIELLQLETINNIFTQLQRISSPVFKAISIDNLCSFWNIPYSSKNQHQTTHFQNFKHPNQIFYNMFPQPDGNIMLERFIPKERPNEWLDIHSVNNSNWFFLKLCKYGEKIHCSVYACLVDSIIHTYDQSGKWVYNNLMINLPINTIILATVYKNTFFILDAIMLDGVNITGMPFHRRLEKIKIFTKIISTISDTQQSKNYLKISTPEFVRDCFNKQLQTDMSNVPSTSAHISKHLYLAINEHILVSKCLFIK